MSTFNTVENLTISKLKLKDRTIYVKIKWRDCEQQEMFNIKLYDGETCLQGSFSQEDARRYAVRVHENLEDYSRDVRISLTGDEGDRFSYELVMLDTNTVFRWKKRFEDAMLLHGAVSVIQKDGQTKDTLLDCLLTENKSLKQSLTDSSKQINELNSDLEKYKNELEKAVSLKTSQEMSLLSKFEQLLNAKKNRIKLLEDTLMKLENAS